MGYVRTGNGTALLFRMFKVVPTCVQPRGRRGCPQRCGLAQVWGQRQGVSKRTFLVSSDKRRGAPDLWPHFTGH